MDEAKAQAALHLAYEALTQAEYQGWMKGYPCCPVCLQDADERVNKGIPHREGCELAAAIAAIAELLPEVKRTP